ncbi:MAG: AAA family ATPase, partial [Paludibacteraceae bacterium]|nr:AAA family ATPase [Paludibacteraceae bacterium]
MKDYTKILGYEPSQYQLDVFEHIVHGQGNAVIRAVAGAGKTSTIVAAMKLVPKTKKCLFIAFNRSIVEELTNRLSGYTNCTIKTIHSLGLQIVRRNIGEVDIDEYKYKTFIKSNITELTTV